MDQRKIALNYRREQSCSIPFDGFVYVTSAEWIHCAETAPNLDQSFSLVFPAEHGQGWEESVRR